MTWHIVMGNWLADVIAKGQWVGDLLAQSDGVTGSFAMISTPVDYISDSSFVDNVFPCSTSSKNALTSTSLEQCPSTLFMAVLSQQWIVEYGQ